MTREEIIKEYEAAVAAHAAASAAGVKGAEKSYELFKAGLSALRPVSREQVEKMFPGCPYCDMAKANDNIYNKALWVKEAKTSKWTLAGKSLQYCPICGRPLTDEAVQMVMERLEALYEQTSD